MERRALDVTMLRDALAARWARVEVVEACLRVDCGTHRSQHAFFVVA